MDVTGVSICRVVKTRNFLFKRLQLFFASVVGTFKFTEELQKVADKLKSLVENHRYVERCMLVLRFVEEINTDSKYWWRLLLIRVELLNV